MSLSTSSAEIEVEVVETEITQVKNPLLKTDLSRATLYNWSPLSISSCSNIRFCPQSMNQKMLIIADQNVQNAFGTYFENKPDVRTATYTV